MLKTFIACALIATIPASAQDFTDEHFYLDYGGPSGDPYAMLRMGRKIYIGGGFLTTAGQPNLKNLARFNLDTESWEQVPGIDRNFNNFVRSLHHTSDGKLIVGGDFTSIGGVAGQKIARFDPQTNEWSQLLDPTAGDDAAGPLGSGVQSITSSGDYIYIGADIFWNTDNQDWKHIRRFNTETNRWSSVGDGLDGTVHAMTTDSSGNVFAGGGFSRSGSTDTSSLAVWNGSSWSEVGGGVGDTGFVRALAIGPDGRLFVGGQFSSVGGQPANNIAAWNGSTWDTLDGGILGDTVSGVFGMSIDESGRLYICGEFNRLGSDGTAINNVALWDGSGSWKALGSGLGKSSTQIVNSCYATGNDAYFGGVFADPNGSPNVKKNFARWNTNIDFTNYIAGLSGLEKSVAIERTGTDIVVSFATISGNTYYLQSCDASLSNWRDASFSQSGADGRSYTFSIPLSGAAPFYRVRVE